MRVGTRPRATGGGIWHELVVRDMAVGTGVGGGREQPVALQRMPEDGQGTVARLSTEAVSH